MKHVKKLASLLLSLVMVLGLATTAFAANGVGTITVSNSTVDATYSLYKVFDATVSTDGNIAYKADSALAENDYFATDAKLNVTVKDAAKDAQGNLTADAIDWLKANYVTGKTAIQTATGDGDAIVFTNVPYGYYIVTSTVNNGAAVTVTSTKPNATIVDKNQVPSWDNEDPTNPDPDYPDNPGKVIVLADGTKTTVNSANYGDTVDFSIAVNATAYVGTELATHYYISDTLADGFSAATNIVVKVSGQTLIKDTDYTLTQTGNSFEIDIPFGEKYGSNAKIEVTYSATVETDAVIAGDGNLNTANFTYSTDSTFDPDDPGYDPKDPTDPDYPNPDDPTKPYDEQNKKTTTTYVYALGIKKVDPKGNALTGAEFSVTDAAGNDIYATATDTAGVYEFCAADAEGAVTQFKTDDKGVLIIKGLKAGTYTVKEEVAPAGYNLLPSTVDVTAEISETNTYTTTITTYYDADGNVVETKTEGGNEETTAVSTNVVPLVVVNNTGTLLPSTGGMGTTLFYVIGGLLVVAAAVLLITKKRMSQAER